MSHCRGGADPIVASLFHDCLYNFRDYLGFVSGLASILTWMVAQFPQIISNARNRSAEALSVWFLAEWLMGDTCNLIGCLLTGDQLVTQTYTAMYFICADIVLVMQYIYYGTLQRRRQRSIRSHRTWRQSSSNADGVSSRSESSSRYPAAPYLGQAKPRILACFALFIVGTQFFSSHGRGIALEGLDRSSKSRRLLQEPLMFVTDANKAKTWKKNVGQMIGWVSSALYLGSRGAQITKNWSRQSAEGLSIAMFMCAITANVLYGIGILARSYTWENIESSAPWLLGSLGTVFLDLIIFSQFSMYNRNRRRAETADPLLSEEAIE